MACGRSTLVQASTTCKSDAYKMNTPTREAVQFFLQRSPSNPHFILVSFSIILLKYYCCLVLRVIHTQFFFSLIAVIFVSLICRLDIVRLFFIESTILESPKRWNVCSQTGAMDSEQMEKNSDASGDRCDASASASASTSAPKFFAVAVKMPPPRNGAKIASKNFFFLLFRDFPKLYE